MSPSFYARSGWVPSVPVDGLMQMPFLFLSSWNSKTPPAATTPTFYPSKLICLTRKISRLFLLCFFFSTILKRCCVNVPPQKEEERMAKKEKKNLSGGGGGGCEEQLIAKKVSRGMSPVCALFFFFFCEGSRVFKMRNSTLMTLSQKPNREEEEEEEVKKNLLSLRCIKRTIRPSITLARIFSLFVDFL